MRLLRASAEGRLDRELSAISKARLLVIDELGYVPVDEEGSRLPGRDQRVRAAERDLHHEHRVQRLGTCVRRPGHGDRDRGQDRASRQDDQVRGRVVQADPRPDGIGRTTAAGLSLNWTETRRFFGLDRHAVLDYFNLTKHSIGRSVPVTRCSS